MSKRRAIFTEADLRRAMKAAKAEGFDRVEVVHPETGVKIVCEKTAKPEKKRPAEVME